MFTWICPQCGREVPPHESDCPYCRERDRQAGEQQPAAGPQPVPPQQPPAPVASPPATPPQPVSPHPAPQQWAQPAQAQQPQPGYQAPIPQQGWTQQPLPPPGYQAPPPPGYQTLRRTIRQRRAEQQEGLYEINGQRGMPGWLVALLVAAVIVGLGAVGYYYVLPSLRGGAAATRESPFEKVQQAGQAAAGNRLSRYVEVTGFRISEDANKRTQIQFLVVNHSPADIGDLAGTVRLRTTQSKPDDPPISEFDFKTTRLGPYESIEFKTLIKTSLRAYELPDWQYLTADVEITSPKEL